MGDKVQVTITDGGYRPARLAFEEDTPTSEMGRLIDEVARLGRQNEELRDTNQTLREAVSSMFSYTSVCPFCREYGRTQKHGATCELARALGGVE